MSKKNPQIRNVVVISDTHFGCRLGLCPPDGIELDDGGEYRPSRMQKIVWRWWEEFWKEWVPAATNGEPYVLVHNGDVIDGVHHNATTQISHNILDQKRLAVKVLTPVVGQAEKFYSIRGTAAHVGQSSVHEEEVAESLGAVRNQDQQRSRYELWLKLGEHLIHFLHHIGTTSSSAHESSAVNAEMAAEFVEAARWGEKPPSVIVRSHRHRAMEVRLPSRHGYVTAAVTPAWQLKTPFAWKVAGARLAPPQLGGLVVRLDESGNPYTKCFTKHIERDDVATV